MKKTVTLILTLAILFTLAACGGKAKTQVNVFAAASMTETLTEIEKKYEAAHSDIDLVFTFDSSGTLKTQIEEGAPCDLFISAAPKQMDQLQELGMVDVDTRIKLLENRVVLCVAEGNPAEVNNFDDLAHVLKAGNVLLALGNADVPVGQYTQKIFAYFGLDEDAMVTCLTYGSNVKEVTTAVLEGTADCGIIYATDAYSAGLTPVDTATDDMCGAVIYPIAVLSNAQHPEEAQDFLFYLTEAEASAIFEKVGFTPFG